MRPIKGVIFDFDGLVIDSEDADRIAWTEEFARTDHPVSDAEYAAFWHSWSWQRQIRMIQRLAERAGTPIDQEAILASRLARYTQLCAGLPARPGIAGWFTQARDLGLKIGVATNDDTGRATTHLARLGLDGYLDTVVVLEPGLARKPAPDLYAQALRLLGLDAAEAVAVEDSSHGVAAAHRAGMKAIAYPTPTVSAHTDLSAADLIVDSAADTPLAVALAALADTPSRSGRQGPR